MTHNPYILHIDTATEVCSVSLSQGELLLDTIETREPNQHANKLTLFIKEILDRHKILHTDLAAVAVSKGPGSYTGLRIGVSTAKGLCYALDIPLISINTLSVLFEGYKSQATTATDTLYCPMIDARRMEVYMAIWDGASKLIEPTSARIIDQDSFEAYGAKNIHLFGSGAPKFKELFADNPQISIAPNYLHSSKHMHQLALQRFIDQQFEDLIYFEPFYLKEFMVTTPKKK